MTFLLRFCGVGVLFGAGIHVALPGEWREGQATYHYFSGTTACGLPNSDQYISSTAGAFPNGFITAMGSDIFNSGQGCGGCFEIECVGPKEASNVDCSCKSSVSSVIVQAVDLSGTFSPPHFDIASEAWSTFTDTSCGSISVRFREVACAFTRNIEITTPANDAWWFAMRVDYVAGYGQMCSISIRSKQATHWIVCSNSGSQWVCDDASLEPTVLPITVKLQTCDGAELIGEDVITAFGVGTFDFGSNFAWDGSSAAPTSTTATTTTTAAAATTSTSASSAGTCYSNAALAINVNNEFAASTQCGADASSPRCADGSCCSQWGYCGTTPAYCNSASIGDWRTASCSTVSTPSTTAVGASATSSTEAEAPSGSGDAAADVERVLSAAESAFDTELFLYEASVGEWLPSTVYRFAGFISGLRTMYQTGVAGQTFYVGSNTANGYKYGLVNIAAFLAQSMKETIKYDACDENNWDAIGGVYPLSNACGQLSQSYQDYACSAAEADMQCEVDVNMEMKARTNAKWWGAPGPLFCGPKSKYPATGYWDPSQACPGGVCTEYGGQTGGAAVSGRSANQAGRTDVEGCCFWGRGVIQTTGVCNIGKLNYWLGAKAFARTGTAAYPDVDFCKRPDYICSEEYPALKWVAGFFYWMQSVQTYDVNGWNYMAKLQQWVDAGMPLSDTSFIDAVSGIVNRGCTSLVCPSGAVDGVEDRRANFVKVMDVMMTSSATAFTIDTDGDNAEEKRNNATLIVLVVVSAVLLVAMVAAFIYYRRRSGRKEVQFDHNDGIPMAEVAVAVDNKTEEAQLTQTNDE